ncbi:MAG: nucleotidyl transferase AbiEii/AbiGii toxin family protein [Magnetococcales bacterium]|nr:nucleotidyl transferase AbiEii/AbiGii toxin family protein [Magnetococcales bacterium]
MPLTKLQTHVLRVLATQRTPESYIAGGIALNRMGPRFSEDIDIFQDSEACLVAVAEADHAALVAAGLKVTWLQMYTGKRQALIEGLGATMHLDWVADSDFRFFPAQPDDLFGFVLHPADLATNKAAAAADRRVPRDIVDLVTIHESILPLGAVVCAAVGRFPGQSPEGMLSEIRRHGRFTAEEFRVLATESPIDVPGMHRRIRRMIEEAEDFIGRIPSEFVGFIFLSDGTPVQPDLDALENYQCRAGTRCGLWPSSPEISRVMLERYKKPLYP